jgi:hypothetical protein
MFNDEARKTFNPTHVDPGVAFFLQNLFIFLSSLVFKVYQIQNFFHKGGLDPDSDSPQIVGHRQSVMWIRIILMQIRIRLTSLIRSGCGSGFRFFISHADPGPDHSF